ncbi:MAG TPA: hypothetical protein VH307_11960 [Streptosporangiaceae bacterium]|jgi:hypothetical protein|nr:hypothetical protein [Streptosporangiaceae bacterium]
MNAEPLEPLIELDDRGRTNLRRFGAEPHARYLVTVRGDGTITLHPAVAMTVHEAAMWREKPELMRQIAGHVSGREPLEMIPVSPDDL